jgi:hypothetical protein
MGAVVSGDMGKRIAAGHIPRGPDMGNIRLQSIIRFNKTIFRLQSNPI